MTEKIYDQREDLLAADPTAFNRMLGPTGKRGPPGDYWTPEQEALLKKDFPARDPSKPDTEQGIYEKYRVYRTDGLDNAGGPRADDKYFVLNLTRDPHAKPAMAAYAASAKGTHPILSADMIREVMGGGAIDTLVALIEHGPRESCDIPSKVGLNELIGCACVVQIVVKNELIHYAATPAGADAYLALFGGATLREAKQRRQAPSRRAYDAPLINPTTVGVGAEPIVEWADRMRAQVADEKHLESLARPVATVLSAPPCRCGIGLCEGNKDGSCRVRRPGVPT